MQDVLGFRGIDKTFTKYTAQKMKFSIKDYFSKCGFGHIY